MSINPRHLFEVARDCITSPIKLLQDNKKEIAEKFEQLWSINDRAYEKDDLVERIYIPLILGERQLEREAVENLVASYREKYQEALACNKEKIKLDIEAALVITTIPYVISKILDVMLPKKSRPHSAKKLLDGILFIYKDEDNKIDLHAMTEELASITLHHCFNKCFYKGDPLQNTIMEVGEKVQQHLESVWFIKNEALYHNRIEEIKKIGESRGLVSSLERLVGHNIDWSADDQFNVGNLLVSALEESKNFIITDFTQDQTKYKCLVLNGEYQNRLNHTNSKLLNKTYFAPMVVPPKPWTFTTDGGYWTVSNKLFNMKELALQKKVGREWDKSNINEFLSSINIVQEVPWRINKRVLKVYSNLLGTGLAGLPDESLGNNKLPRKPWKSSKEYEKLLAEDRKQISDYYEAKSVFEYYKRIMQKAADCRARYEIAEKFKNYEMIWFPHFCDFRGRIYPSPLFLHPEISEDGKALIEFAEGKALGKNGYIWLSVHLANMAGEDKISFKKRIEWVTENEENIIASARDPLGYSWWMDTERIDKPFQFLAACFAYCDWKEQGADYLCHLPIEQDGSNNGIQHLSAMSRDPNTGKLVNLLPGDKPEDIYQVIADTVSERVEKDVNKGIEEAIAWNGKVNRKIVKQPAMTFSYGSTFDGIRDQIVEVLLELDEKSKEPYIPISNWKAASYLAKQVWKSLEYDASGPFEVMKWLKNMAKLCSKDNKPIKWTSAIGLPVTQAYYMPQNPPKRVNIYWGLGELKRRLRLTLQRDSNKIDAIKSQNSISPNFVHSMDASHLLMTVYLAKKLGYEHFACIHDSIATHACDVDAIRRIIWFTFKLIYSKDRLVLLKQEIKERKIADLPSFEHYGDLELNEFPLYFFA